MARGVLGQRPLSRARGDALQLHGAEILVAHHTDDAMAALALGRAALADVARRARERTLDEHTADRRAAELVRRLEDAGGATSAASASALTASEA